MTAQRYDKAVKQFRTILPIAQPLLAIILGCIGEWQRWHILTQRSFFGDGWHSTARFHVWPWPLKFAVITTMPTMFPGALLSLIVRDSWEEAFYMATLVLAYLAAPVLWYWIGYKFDHRWTLQNRKPWIALSIFNLIALTGSLVGLGTVGYMPFSTVLWIFWIAVASRRSRINGSLET